MHNISSWRLVKACHGSVQIKMELDIQDRTNRLEQKRLTIFHITITTFEWITNFVYKQLRHKLLSISVWKFSKFWIAKYFSWELQVGLGPSSSSCTFCAIQSNSQRNRSKHRCKHSFCRDLSILQHIFDIRINKALQQN